METYISLKIEESHLFLWFLLFPLCLCCWKFTACPCKVNTLKYSLLKTHTEGQRCSAPQPTPIKTFSDSGISVSAPYGSANTFLTRETIDIRYVAVKYIHLWNDFDAEKKGNEFSLGVKEINQANSVKVTADGPVSHSAPFAYLFSTAPEQIICVKAANYTGILLQNELSRNTSNGEESVYGSPNCIPAGGAV